MALRPILKALPDSDGPLSPDALPFASCNSKFSFFSQRVHFPPTPALTSTQITHSPGSYDRAPIVVAPNSCALPERGGRVYQSATSRSLPKGSYFHPRAFEACECEQSRPSPPPPASEPPALIPDVSSSETDESDGCWSPDPSSPPAPSVATPNPALVHYAFASRPIPRTHSQEEFDHALSFLPYPPAQLNDKPKPKRRRSLCGRRFRELCRSKEQCAFREEGLDGCLGGF